MTEKLDLLRIAREEQTGDLFKLLWYERGVVAQHEKKTNVATGHVFYARTHDHSRMGIDRNRLPVARDTAS